MSISFFTVGLICLLYLGVLFAVAQATEKGWIPDRLITHPVTYIFSLGIFASAWSYYGVIELAGEYGYGALAYYLGTGVLFLFAPIALKPLFELARRFQINSMADLLTFRYGSQQLGAIATLFMLLAMAPLLALQIQAVADTGFILAHLDEVQSQIPGSSKQGSQAALAFVYCALVAVFAMKFGSKHEHHKGLITVMAFESVVKLIGLVAGGLFAVYAVFGGFDQLDIWLAENPAQLEHLYQPIANSSSHTLILVFLATAVSMPHIFHMTVVENPTKHASKTVSWAFPLFLFVMALPIFPILWAGIKLDSSLPLQYFPLANPIETQSVGFTILAFIAGLSAATGALIAISLAISTMIMNHWILPRVPLGNQRELYAQVIRLKRTIIFCVVFTGYGFYWFLNNQFSITSLAFMAFIATLQFFPGVIAVAHWSRGNRKGVVAGLLTGMTIWFFGMLLPTISGISSWNADVLGVSLTLGVDHWSAITLWSLGLNTIIFVLVSLATKQTDDERYSAELCSEDELSHPIRLTLDIRSPSEFVERLSKRIGASTAQKEVDRALSHLGLGPNERRPYALRRLRDELEANLSGLLGISMASEIMDRQVPFISPENDIPTDITLIENRLSQYRDHLTGLAAELNNLRLYHRRTLEELPMAVCSIGKDSEILMWNAAMQALSSIKSSDVTGSHLLDVSEPWGSLLHEFSQSSEPRLYRKELTLNHKPHWISLHKANIPTSVANKIDGQVILLEDTTEIQLLEKELMHSERLASVGRLAAGVAHEIGNPVTGIACLAQNLEYEVDEAEIRETSEQILSQTDRVTRIVQSLVSFSHAGTSDFQKCNLKECAQEAINLLSLQKEKQQVHYQNNLSEDINIVADGQKIIQIFVNLLSNSRDASEDGATIWVDGEDNDTRIEFSVTDEGSGIPKSVQEQIFEPFFTTKDPGEGTGLGLAMVYSIIEDHHGHLDIVSPVHPDKQNGTRFVINLPKSLETSATKGNTTG